jgi:hypothetical protein
MSNEALTTEVRLNAVSADKLQIAEVRNFYSDKAGCPKNVTSKTSLCTKQIFDVDSSIYAHFRSRKTCSQVPATSPRPQ